MSIAVDWKREKEMEWVLVSKKNEWKTKYELSIGVSKKVLMLLQSYMLKVTKQNEKYISIFIKETTIPNVIVTSAFFKRVFFFFLENGSAY